MKKIFKTTSVLFLLFLSVVSVAQKKWTLRQCIAYAKEHNVDVIKQKIQNEILSKDVTIAKGNYLPDASFNASQNFSLGNSFNVSTSVGQRESSSNSFSLSSSLVVFNGFANKYKLQKAILFTKKSIADIEKIRFDLTLNITNKYLQVLFNKEIVKIAKEQVKISQDNYARLQRLFKKALVNKKEFLEIQATLATDKKEVVIANNKVTTSLLELRDLLGIKEIKNFDIAALIVKNNVDIIPQVFTDKVLENNPTIKSSLFSLEIKKKEIQLTKINFYPRININYSYSSNYFHILGEDDKVFNQQTNTYEPNGFWTQLNNNRTHYIGISAVIPIFNRFITRENYNKSKEELKISEIELENNKQQLKNKITIAQNDLTTARATLTAAETAFLTQKEAFTIASQLYEKGSIASYQFLESKSKLIINNSEYIKAKYDLLFKKKIIEYYLSD